MIASETVSSAVYFNMWYAVKQYGLSDFIQPRIRNVKGVKQESVKIFHRRFYSMITSMYKYVMSIITKLWFHSFLHFYSIAMQCRVQRIAISPQMDTECRL